MPIPTGTVTQIPSGRHSPSTTAKEGSTKVGQLEGYPQNASRSPHSVRGALKDRNHVPPSVPENNTLQSICKPHTAATPSQIVHPDSQPRTELAAHRLTRDELAKTKLWCKSLEEENTNLLTQLDEARRERTLLQRRLDDASDANLNLDIALSDAGERIRALSYENELYVSEIERLRNEIADLSADVNCYRQIGTVFYTRLKKAEEVLRPSDRVFAEYQRLMRDVARFSPMGVEAREEGANLYDDVARFEEISDADRTEGDWNNQNVNDSRVMGSNHIHHASTSTTSTSTTQEKAYTTTSQDDDDDSCPNRPRMRPGTAHRVPLSVFADGASAKEVPRTPSSSLLFENLTSRNPSSQPSTLPTKPRFSGQPSKDREKSAVKEPSQNTPASKTSADRSRSGRGGIEPGRRSRRNGRDRARDSHHGGRDAVVRWCGVWCRCWWCGSGMGK